MDQTKVDDMLIEMITPKVNEIQVKFSEGGALTNTDINTLLLKSQYNHINHLDSKLNEVVADVATLKNEFNKLDVKIDKKIDKLVSNFEILNQNVEKQIAKALNKNMTGLIIIMGLFLTLSKLIDQM